MDGTKQKRQRVRKMGHSQAMIKRTEEWASGLAQKYQQERIEKHGGLENYLKYLESVCLKNGITLEA